MSKYKKPKASMVDLSSRKKIKIIEGEKKLVSDEEMKAFENQLDSLSKQAEEFNTYFIEQTLKENVKISDDEFNSIMKNILKQHKILKSMIDNNKDTSD